MQKLFSIILPGLLCSLSLGHLLPGQQLQMADLPGHDRYESARKLLSAFPRASLRNHHWETENNKLYFTTHVEKTRWQIDLTTGEVSEAVDEPKREGRETTEPNRRRMPRVGRAKQRTELESPDKSWKAVYRDNNVYLEPIDQNGEASTIQVTTEGKAKLRYGTACWVYGEELNQQEAMWFSPDSSKLAFYEINENHMKTYFLTTGNTDGYTDLHKEQYPIAGEDNPHVALIVFDIASGEKTRINVDGPQDQYIYNVRFSPDGSELLFNRTNRWQNQLDVMAANPSSGNVRTIHTETQNTWQKNSPTMRFLSDNQRFIWETERNGWRQFELRHLDGRKLNQLSPVSEFACMSIVKLDEESGWFYYSAYSDDNPLNLQLHRVRLDGTEHQKLTTRSMNYSSFVISDDHQWFTASFQAVDQPVTYAAYDMNGKELAVISEVDNQSVSDEGFSPVELFSFTAEDGETEIYGTLIKPRNFDPEKKYPLLISVYGGPSSVGVANRYSAGNPSCEFGFLIAKIGNRGTVNRGKAFESANYLKLGIVDLDDQAAGVRHLAQRDYIDGDRVGIYGHSYGGYMSALALLRYPGVFHVGVCGAPVTDWRNYDTIYTERYMRTPQENGTGYDAGSCMKFVDQLQGKLFLLHGLVDDNVHPSNTWQLVEALQKANKRFDLMVYPNSAHGFGYNSLRMEYFIRHLQPKLD